MRVKNPTAFGLIETNDKGKIRRFLEKPSWGEAFSDTINTGTYILEPSAIELIPEATNYDFSQNLYPLMLSRQMRLYGKIMQGYWKRPDTYQETFVELEGKTWLRTGDLVRMDEEGYFHFFDRKRDLIKFKGYSVFARHVEEVLYNHPQIKAAGVVGVPDPKVGNIIKAYVVLQSEARGKISEEEIMGFCRENLAHYKVPGIIEFRGELPKTDVGKISRRELREEAEEI